MPKEVAIAAIPGRARPVLTAPFRDYSGRFSLLKSGTFVALWLPAGWMAGEIAAGNWIFPSEYVPLIYHSGVWATWMLLIGLAVTPLRAIFRLNGLVAVRRMIGLAALAYTLLHLFAWLGLRYFDAAYLANELWTRPTLWVATLSLIGLVALGATSFDAAVRWLGGVRWAALHRTIYWLAGLAVLHFLMSPGSLGGLPFAMAGMYLWLMLWRVSGRRAREPGWLAGMAVGSAVATLLLEPAWIALYHGERALMGPAATLAANFDPAIWAALGAPPAALVLGHGVAIAAAAAVRQRAARMVTAATSG